MASLFVETNVQTPSDCPKRGKATARKGRETYIVLPALVFKRRERKKRHHYMTVVAINMVLSLFISSVGFKNPNKSPL